MHTLKSSEGLIFSVKQIAKHVPIPVLCLVSEFSDNMQHGARIFLGVSHYPWKGGVGKPHWLKSLRLIMSEILNSLPVKLDWTVIRMASFKVLHPSFWKKRIPFSIDKDPVYPLMNNFPHRSINGPCIARLEEANVGF